MATLHSTRHERSRSEAEADINSLEKMNANEGTHTGKTRDNNCIIAFL